MPFSALGLVSYAFSLITPNYHDFSLLDLTIAYPYKGDTVSDIELLIASVLGPIVIIFVVCVIFVPVPMSTASRNMSTGQVIHRKVWELYVAWMGLALSLISQFLLVQALKNMIGKPRPDMLARCNPDTFNVARYAVGGFGQAISDRWILVNQTICGQSDKAILNDGFRSFPSGHSASKLPRTYWLRSNG